MRAYLEHEDLWKCVTGDESDSSKNTKAKAKIILALDPVNYVHVQSANSAKEAWDNLTAAFDDKGLTRRVGLLRLLITTRLEDCDTVEEYVNRIIQTSHQLGNIGFSVSDEWVGSLLLAGLPSEYRPMIMGIENSGIKISGDLIKTKLLQDVKISGTNNSESAFFSKHASNPKAKARSKGPGPRCYECNKFGHFARNCSRRVNKPMNYVKSKPQALFSVLSSGKVDNDEWYIDSGASTHITNNKHLLTKVKETKNDTVIIANNKEIPVKGVGNVLLDINKGSKKDKVEVKDVLLVPDLSANILSVSKIVEKGLSVKFDSDGCKIRDRNNNLIASGKLSNGMFKLDRPTAVEKVNLTTKSNSLIHRRLGHLNQTAISKIEGQNNLSSETSSGICPTCLEGKQAKLPFISQKVESRRILELVHTDLCGPMERKSLGGSKYIITFIDDFSKKIFVYFLKNKDQVPEIFQEFKSRVETQMECKIKILRSDNGGEYINERLAKLLKTAGIQHQTTIPYTPQQNGLAERANRTIIEKARCLLFDAELGKEFWAEAIATAVYLINRSPTKSLQWKSPEEIWTGRKIDLSHLRIFGCKAYAHIPDVKRQKFDRKSEECILMGYCEDSKGYRLYNTRTKQFLHRRNVIFDENNMKRNDLLTSNDKQYFTPQTNESSTSCPLPENENHIEARVTEDISSDEDPVSNDERFLSASHDQSSESDNTEQEAELLQLPRRSGRILKPTKMDDYYLYMVETYSSMEPITFQDALDGPNAEQWKQAAEAEFNSLQDNETWELVDLPRGQKAINCKWIFKIKKDAEGNIDRYKARLVIKGCAQREGIDYQETYSPVVRHTSVRLLMAIAARFNLDVEHMDAVTAFLHGELTEDIYMVQPEGFVVKGEESKVCHLKKAMYGLKQGSRAWNKKLDHALTKYGLTRSSADPCVYFAQEKESILIVAIYVDDLIIFSNDNNRKARLKEQLTKCFNMKDLGPISQCLGIRITRDRKNGKIWLDQSSYISEILKRFNMSDCNPVNTPMDPNQKLTKEMSPKTSEEIAEMGNIPYQEAVGSLMYLCQATRPDIVYSVSMLSRFNKNPGKLHWLAVKRVMRYLKGTMNVRLEFAHSASDRLLGYCDADWANDLDDRRSNTGYVFTLQGGAVSWNSRKQPTVALSSTEAEYMSLAAACQEGIWLRRFQQDLSPQLLDEGLVIHCDNRSAIDLGNNECYRARTKHIDVRHHFIRDNINKGIIKLQHIETKKMIADINTKALPAVIHNDLMRQMGLKELPSIGIELSSKGGVGMRT